MELVQQHGLPERAQLLGRILRAAEPVRERRRGLRLAEQPLAGAVAALGARLAREGAAVVLEVELALDRPRRAEVLLEPVEELRGRRELHARDALQVAGAARHLEHLRGRPAAAVAVAEHEQARRRAVVVLEARGARAQLGDRDHRVVGVGRRHVHEHLGAVDPGPRERVVRRLGELVPGQLLGEEAVDPRAAQDLRDLAVVAERVRRPELAAARAEALPEVALAVEQLAHQRLAAREVEIGLHPRAADDLPAALADALAQPLVEPGRVLLEPRVVLRRGGREAVLGVAVHQRELARPRAHDLAPRLGQRPQPGGVDVRVADRGDVVGAAGVAVGVEVAEDRPRLGPGGAVGGDERAGEAVELGEQPALPGGLQPRLLDELAQRLEVPRQLPRLGIDQREPGALEAGGRAGRAQRAVVGGVLPGPAGAVAALRERVRQAHQVVAGHLELELHAAGRRAERRGGAVVAAALDEPLHGRAVAVQQRLAAAVPDELDGAPGPVLGDGRGEPEPVGRPLRPERLADLRRAVAQRLRVGVGDAARLLAHEQLVGRHRLRMDQRAQPARGLGDAGAGLGGTAVDHRAAAYEAAHAGRRSACPRPTSRSATPASPAGARPSPTRSPRPQHSAGP